ncbi:MAG: hypothetical protein Q7T33_16040 [Dehalococcoidia bacterium]|nr:hypothetical protein [Dehalococcoidia bacterium]
MKGSSARVAIAMLVLGLILAWGYGYSSGTAEAAPASASSFTFGQLDWYDENGSLQVDDSSWGYMEVDVVGHPTQTEYLNVTANAGTGEKWIVQNLPIFPDTIGNASPRQGVDFDITLFDDPAGTFPAGTDLFSLDYVFTVDAAIRPSAPAGAVTNAFVAEIERHSFGSELASPALPVAIGEPAGVQIQDAVKNVIQHKDVPGVQEKNLGCIKGAFARSIAWLTGEITPQQVKKIYDDLDNAMGPHTSQGGTNSYTQKVKIKNDYLKGKIPGATTKINDLQNAIGPIAGVPEVTEDLVTWLKKELPTEDVELQYGGHIVTVTGMYESGGKTFIRYRDDETQGDDAKGDKAEKTGELRKVGNDYQFRAKGGQAFFTVQAAISESKPTVGGTTELLTGGGEPAVAVGSGSSTSNPLYGAIAGGIAAALAIATSGWYARRVWLRKRAA